MKNTLLKLGALIAALGLVAFLVNQEEQTPAPKSLVIEGYATAEELSAEKGRGILDGPADIAYPVDEIVIVSGENTTRLVRTGSAKTLQWNLSEPMEAAAVKFRVEKMVKLFKDKTSSVHTKAVTSEDLALFDLEAERRIRVTLKAQGQVWNGVDLIIGRVEESESQASQDGVVKDTWAMIAGEEDTAYRLGGKDLRSDFEVATAELRDKKLFTVKAEDLVEIEVSPPTGAKITLKGTRSEAPASEEGKDPKVTVDWKLTAPKGFQADASVKTFARNIANARTKAFIPASEGPKEGLGKASWTLSAKTHEGKTIGVRIASEGEPAWGQVAGREEWVQIESYTAKNLRKTLADLRDKTLWSLSESDVSGVTFGPVDKRAAKVTRRGADWSLGDGAPADMTNLLKHMATVKAKRFATPEEIATAEATLATPSFQAMVQSAKSMITLSVGPEITEGDLKGNRWVQATRDGKAGDYALLAEFSAKRFLKGRSDLLRKTFFSLTRDAIQRIDVTHADGTKVSLEKSAASGSLELLGLSEGQKTKQPAVGTMVGTLPNLKAKTLEPQTSAKDAGLVAKEAMRVDVLTNTGNTHSLLVSDKTSGPDPYAMALSGPLANQVATINNFQALNLRKKAPELTE